MNVIFLLAPFSVVLGLMAVGAFFWTLRSGQYEDIQGSAERILIDDADQPDGDPPRPGTEAPGPEAGKNTSPSDRCSGRI